MSASAMKAYTMGSTVSSMEMAGRTRTLERMMADMNERYRKNPRGWRVYVRQGKHGHGDIFIHTSDEEVWQIKVDSLYRPKPVGVGLRMGIEEEASSFFDKRLPSYGFRPATSRQIGILRGGLHGGGDAKKVLSEILGRSPTAPSETEHGFVQGPIVHTADQRFLSSSQRELDAKLETTLTNLLRKKGTLSAYG